MNYKLWFYVIFILVFLSIAIYDLVKIRRKANSTDNSRDKELVIYKLGILKLRIGEVFTIAQFGIPYNIFFKYMANFIFFISMGILAVVFLIIGRRELYKLQSISNIPFEKAEKISSLFFLILSGLGLIAHVVLNIIASIQLKRIMNGF